MLKVTKAYYKIYIHTTQHIMKNIVLLRFKLKTKLKKEKKRNNILKYLYEKYLTSCIYTFKKKNFYYKKKEKWIFI